MEAQKAAADVRWPGICTSSSHSPGDVEAEGAMSTITIVTTGASGKLHSWRKKLFDRAPKPTSPAAHKSNSQPTANGLLAAPPATAPAPAAPTNQPQHTSGMWLLPTIPSNHPLSAGALKTDLRTHLESELDAHVQRSLGSRAIQFMQAGQRVDGLYPSMVVTYEDKREKKEASTFCSKLDWLHQKRNQYQFNFHILLAEKHTKVEKSMALSLDNRFMTTKASILISLDALTLCGSTVLVHDDTAAVHKKCVLGGLILVDGVLYGLLPRHPFDQHQTSAQVSEVGIPISRSSEDSERPSSTSSADEHPFTLSFEGHEEAETSYPQPSIYLPGSSRIVSEFDREQASLASLKYHISVGVHVYIPTTEKLGNSRSGLTEIDMDWALADLSEIPKTLMSAVIRANKVGNDFVEYVDNGTLGLKEAVKIAVPGPRPISGILDPLPVSLRSSGSSHDVRLVVLEKALLSGNSGAWVASANTLYGFVIATQGTLPWCYIVPIHHVLADIRHKLQATNVRLPKNDEVADIAGTELSTLSAVGSPKDDFTILSSKPPLRNIQVASDQNGRGSRRAVLRQKAANLLPSSGRTSSMSSIPTNSMALVTKSSSVFNKIKLLKQPQTREVSSLDSVATSNLDLATTSSVSQPPPGDRVVDTSMLSKSKQDTARVWSHPVANPFLTSIDSPGELQPTPLIPKTVLCALHITCGTMFKPAPVMIHLDWTTPSSYQILHDAAMASLRKRFPDDDDNAFYRKNGNCRLIQDFSGAEFSSRVLNDEQQFNQTVPLLVVGFTTEHPYEKFHLEVCWNYSYGYLNPPSGQSFARAVRNALYGKMRLNFEGKKYLPRRDLQAIMSNETVARLIDEDRSLRAMENFDSSDFAQNVFLWARHLLAICVYANIPLACLLQLWNYDVRDTSLPLQVSDRPAEVSPVEFDDLTVFQGSFSPHTFSSSEDRPKYATIRPEVVVPLNFEPETDLLGEGSFSRVFQIHIDPDHHSFSPNLDQAFALKTFRDVGPQTQADFREESRTLELLSRFPHPNIVTHIAAWTQGEKFYMLFPLAESNLREFLQRPSPDLTKTTMISIISQMRGVADGIRHLHNLRPSIGDAKYAGYHHDLKPANILVFPIDAASVTDGESGLVFKISDFGTAKLRTIRSGSFSRNNSLSNDELGQGDVTYGAPDFVLEGRTSRPYDLWSLGCIFLEILIWLLGSPHSSLDEFHAQLFENPESFSRLVKDSAFWYVSQKGKVHLKPTVVEELGFLGNYCHERTVFAALLRLIGRLLVILPSDRLTVSELVNSLDAILIQARMDLRDPDFYLQKRQLPITTIAAALSDFTIRRHGDLAFGPSEESIDSAPSLQALFADADSNLVNPGKPLRTLDADQTVATDAFVTRLASFTEEADHDRPITPSTVDDVVEAQVENNTGVVGHPALLIQKANYTSNTARKRRRASEPS